MYSSSIFSFIFVLICQFYSEAYAARARACGVELYQQDSGRQCGVSLFRQGLGTEECGTQRIEKWSSWGNGCGSVIDELTANMHILNPLAYPTVTVRALTGVVTGDSETRVHRRGWVVKTQTRHRCIVDIPNVCRHPNFGIESFNTCRHPDFGIELYRDCAMMTEEEVVHYMNVTNTWLPSAAQSYALALATFESHQNNAENMACLIRDYENKNIPFLKDITLKLKDIYRNSFGKKYISEDNYCTEKLLRMQNILSASPNGDALRDQALATFQQSRSMLEGQMSQTQNLMQDIVAQNNQSVSIKLLEIHSQISSVIN